MILCGIEDVQAGMRTAASIFHPQRPDLELLSSGVVLEETMLVKLKKLGIARLWVKHDATADLDNLIKAQPSAALHKAFHTLKEDFAKMSDQTVTAGSLQTYRQIVMELVCELVANRNIACMTEQLIGGPGELFTHSANVAYLSVLVGIDLETYIVQQRQRLGIEHARDITALGMGAMLHDIGKVGLEVDAGNTHELDLLVEETTDEAVRDYRHHVIEGYGMLSGFRAPASAMQVVLTHHQRWDGTGFPDMSGPTRNRVKGLQEGTGIHIFSRIVAAANLLENLLSAIGKQRPPVIALHAFKSDRFKGWLDPIVRDSVLRRVPPFPVGGAVRLSDGRAAVVIAPSVEQPCRPIVRLLTEDQKQPDGQPPHLDLREDHSMHIVEYSGHPVERYLFSMVEDAPLSSKVTLSSNDKPNRKASA